ncbi:hypothetical protein [Nostoc sp. DedQUE07]|nr:hypothetical protein [Nostoc sp. DedQUE07]MDZ8130071.1 hypothetical protein [Nostoc sp. DedQUE07]
MHLHTELVLRDRIQELFDQLTFEQVISASSYNFILEALFYEDA